MENKYKLLSVTPLVIFLLLTAVIGTKRKVVGERETISLFAKYETTLRMPITEASTNMIDKGEPIMSTKETIQGYFNSLKQKQGWESFLADDMLFTTFTSPVKTVTGKPAYLEATKRFYSSIISMELRDLLVDGDKACALTHYELRSPKGDAFISDVSEVFTVKGGKIQSFAIYFDSAPFPK